MINEQWQRLKEQLHTKYPELDREVKKKAAIVDKKAFMEKLAAEAKETAGK